MSFHKILMATDFSDSSNKALETAIDLAKAFGASLTIIHVCELPAYSSPNGMMFMPAPELIADIHRDTSHQLATVKERVEKSGLAVKTVSLDGEPRREIPSYADEHGFDLLIVGSHGRRGFKRFVLGSVAEHVVRASQLPVLTVHAKPTPAVSIVGAA